MSGNPIDLDGHVEQYVILEDVLEERVKREIMNKYNIHEDDYNGVMEYILSSFEMLTLEDVYTILDKRAALIRLLK